MPLLNDFLELLCLCFRPRLATSQMWYEVGDVLNGLVSGVDHRQVNGGKT